MDVDLDLSLTGFSAGEIDVILGDAMDPDDEAIPAVPTEPRTRPGDIWVLGDHRIGCGDGRDQDFLRAVIGEDRSIDAAFLDPPYNVRINGHANARGRHREFAMASGEMSAAAFRTFLAETLGACAGVSRAGAVHFVCMDWRHMDDVSEVCDRIYGDLLNLCVWNKSNAGMGSLYRSKHELVFVYRVGDAPHFNAVELGRHGRNRTNVWDYASVNSMAGSRRQDLALHPTVKPTALVADALQDVTRRGDLVLDIFLGSGTTLIAAERTGRAFRGLDIDPAYVDVAMDRWTAMTGGEPRLESRRGGMTAGKTGRGRPPVASRFRKGQSGNPNGRPKAQPPSTGSAFEIVMDRTLTVSRSGVAHQVSVEEALQHQTYRDALSGNRAARNEVFRMIERRERAIAATGAKQRRNITLESEMVDPQNADAALLCLGIASRDPSRARSEEYGEALLLEPWAVQKALSRRRGGARLSKKEVSEIKRCTRDAGSLRWTRRIADD